mgnify:CR=1 FL=1
MQKISIVKLLSIVLFLGLFSGLAFADDLNDLFKQVKKLNIERHGYILGVPLNKGQIKIADANPVESTSKDIFKFRDKNLYVVAQKTSNRVLVIYEQIEEATQQKIKDLIGDLYMQFDDPTVLAHDKIVYWAYEKKGKVSSEAFGKAKEDKGKKLDILATVKFVSEIEIMEKQKEPAKGHVYYTISSGPILNFFKD